MPRKSKTGMDHVKTVTRNGVRYLYFNTGQKVNGKPVYTALGILGSGDVGTRYATAMANRTKRGKVVEAMLVPALIRLWEKSQSFKDRSLGTQKTYMVYLRQLEHAFNNAPADGVEARDIYALIDQMADRPAACAMILLVARQLFKWAKKRHHVQRDPTEGVELEDAKADEYEPWPEPLIEEALDDELVRLPVALLYFTGQRIGDVCDMRWSDIRDDVIHVTQQKTGKALEVPIHSRLAAILADAPRKGITILVDPKGRKAKDQTIRGHLKKFGERHGFTVVPHGLRKNAVNALLEAECSTGEVSAITGQSLKMIEHYAKQRNNPRMGKAAVLKWERSSNRETVGKTGPERRRNA